MFEKVPLFSVEDHVIAAADKGGLSFEDLDFEIRRYITEPGQIVYPAPYVCDKEQRERLNFGTGHCSDEVYSALNPGEKAFVESLHPLLREKFLFFSGASYAWDWNFRLSEKHRWEDRWKENQFLPFVRERLPKLMRLIEHLPFQSIGRAHIMGTSPYHPVHRHYDSDFDDFVGDCMIMRFQPEETCGKAFVDDHLGQAHPAPLRGYCLDDSFPHFVEARPNFHYSIRVNGRFSDGVRPKNHPLTSQWDVLPKIPPSWNPAQT